MKMGSHSLSRLSMFVVGFLTLIALGALNPGRESRVWGQEPSTSSAGQDFFSIDNAPAEIRSGRGIPIDSSTRRLIFSNESSPETQYKFRDEPRFWIQHTLRHRPQAAFGMQPSDIFGTLPDVNQPKPNPKKPKHEKIKGAWLQPLAKTFFNIDTAHGIPYPAKYIFTNTASASCSDWVVFTGPQNGGAADFNLIAVTNLYTGCSGPTIKFAYDGSAASGHALGTSPELSLDGTQIIYAEEGQTLLDILYLPATDTGIAGSTYPAPKPASSLPACSASPTYPPTNAPCRYTFTLQHNASTSEPFIDYGTDTCWIGDDSGDLYKIHPCMTGFPPGANTGTALTPLITPSNKEMSGITLDPSRALVFWNDAGGILWKYNGSTATGTATSSSNSADIEPPIVDVTTAQVFSTSDGNPTGNTPSVVQVPEAFAGFQASPAACTTFVPSCVVGSIGTSNYTTRIGTFNNTYMAGEDATGTILTGGYLYECGPGSSSQAQLYAFSFTSAGVMNSTPASGPLTLTSSLTKSACSPLTENFDGSTDRLFLGLEAACPAPSGGSAIATGCIESFNITSAFPATNTPLANFALADGALGIIIDNQTAGGGSGNLNIYTMSNNAQTTGCSSIYGSDTTASCAASLTQSNLN